MQYQIHMTRNAPDEESIKMIQFYEKLALEHDPRGYCVCTSEGKDSRVLGHLMRRAGAKHFYLHNITGIDPPELVYFQRKNFELYKTQGYLTYDVMHEISMFKLMQKKKIPPLREIRYCCSTFKELKVPQQGNSILSLGVRRFESRSRMKNRNELEVVIGKNKKNMIMTFDDDEDRRTFEFCYIKNEKRLNPIAYWKDEDVWDYSKDVKLEQCSLYYEGFTRLGCIGCPMAGSESRKKEFERWPKFKDIYLRTFERMLKDRERENAKISNYTTTAEDWFNWWLSDRGVKSHEDEAQIKLDEIVSKR